MRSRSSLGTLLVLAVLASCTGASPSGDGGARGGQGGGNGAGGNDAVKPPPGRDKVDTETFIPPGERVVRRLTSTQYKNTVAQALGVSLPVALQLPIDRQVGRFSNGSQQPSPSVAVSKIYADAAGLLATQAVAEGHRNRLFDRKDCEADDPCLEAFIRQMGLRLFRRPVTDGELEMLRTDANANGENFWQRAGFALEVMLQSPSFLYITDTGKASEAHEGLIERDAHTMATRLSLLVWNSGPDDELLAAAGDGSLEDAETFRKQLHRLQADRRSIETQRSFLREWLGYDLAPTKTKGDEHPDYTTALAEAMVAEMDATVTRHIEAQRNASELFALQKSHGSDVVKSFYGVDGDRDGDGAFELPEHRRSILGLAAFLAANSGTRKPSPTLRGKLILNRFLCETVGSPPADAPAELPEAEDAGPLTIRERTERFMLTQGTVCNGCHQMMDPIGFLFEAFDVIGRHRTEETVENTTKPVSSKGSVLALDDRQLDGVGELGKALTGSRQAHACLVRQFLEWGLGRGDEQGDDPLVDALVALDEEATPPLSLLMEALASSQSFRFTRAE